MKVFFRYSVSVIFITTILIVLWHLLFMNYWRFLDFQNPRVWLWGDSQTYQAIDLEKWNGDELFSSAEHGSGYQDLVSFSERLPNKSFSIVGLGPMYYRVNSDRNTGGLSIECSQVMIEHARRFDDPFIDLLLEFRKNFVHEYSLSWITSINHKLYPDSVNFKKRNSFINRFRENCRENDFQEIFNFKDSLLTNALSRISGKSSRMIVLILPIHPNAYVADCDLVTNHFNEKVLELSKQLNLELDTLNISLKEDVFYDATHFKGSFASEFTSMLSSKLRSTQSRSILIIQLENNG